MCSWLETKGFGAILREPRGAIYGNGLVPVRGGARHDIEVSAHTEGGEACSVRCRFAIAPDAQARLERWELFLHDLCGAFELRIGASNDEAVGPEAFLGLVRGMNNWRFFAS